MTSTLRAKKKKQSREIKTGRKLVPGHAQQKNKWIAKPVLRREKKPNVSPEKNSGSKVKPPKAQWEIPSTEPEVTKPVLYEYQMIRLLIDFLGTYEAIE